MAASAMAGGGEMEAGFAKLQGEDFEYYMQTYSILLGRSSKNSDVDLDLSTLGGGMNISRHHARIFYDFARRRFALEVIGKNGCFVEGVHHLPGAAPVKLDSQDLLQIGDTKFYFLLPTRSIFAPSPVPRLAPAAVPYGYDDDDDEAMYEEDDDEEGEDEEEEGDEAMHGSAGKAMPRASGGGYVVTPVASAALAGNAGSSSRQLGKRPGARSKADREADNLQLLQLEEKDVVSSVATVLSDLCGPGDWMPMSNLHSVLAEQYGSVWHHSRVRKYLTSEDWPLSESKGRPWFGLLALLRKYPEHFVINTKSKGKLTSEFVSLVSLLK